MRLKKQFVLCLLLAGLVSLLAGCGKDYCSYGGCMAEATSGGRCSSHQGLPNNPYYGLPD